MRRYLSRSRSPTIVAKLENPCTDEAVQIAIRGLLDDNTARQRQARALGWAEIERFLENAEASLPATRERALPFVAYDTMAQRSELVALNLEDIEFPSDGDGPALIRRSKSNQSEGSQAYLSRTTVRHFKRWLAVAQVRDAAVFGRIVGRGTPTKDADWRVHRAAAVDGSRLGRVQARRAVNGDARA